MSDVSQNSPTGVSPYHTVIEPNQSWWRLDFRSLFRARDLIFLFVHRDFVSKYKQTILGPAWFVVQPILTTGVFMVIQMLGNLGSREVPLPLYNLAGLLAWQYFANIVNNAGATFANNANLFRKVYFPRLSVPISVAVSQLMTLAVQGLFYVVVLGAYVFLTDAGKNINASWSAILLLPFVVMHIALLAVGFAFFTSWLTARYRDLTFLLTFVVQLLLYVTPVIYSLDAVAARLPDGWKWLIFANPMAPIVEFFRHALLGVGGVYPVSYAWSVGLTLFLFLAGMMLFQRTERTFVDSV
ncbi:ABC transporter permease [Pelagicoccus sp. SDUM812002]|uniref:ABC transporter permease n=1 Tax=Pelagicoccus sp. SDUM812002 TaxID=3041266 RepID=UPI00280CCB89|nr:ABC transporter permease [Pelagicoccus sp. SDUM812002]MDQ8184958.1 ABC transporter permease [Pelagicoccus sp. SDUM812002]